MSIIISSGSIFQTPMDLRAFQPLKMYWLPRGLRPRGCRGIESAVNLVRSVVLSHSELWRRGSPSGSKRDGIVGSVWLWERMKEKGKKLQAIDTSEQTSRGIRYPSTEYPRPIRRVVPEGLRNSGLGVGSEGPYDGAGLGGT